MGLGLTIARSIVDAHGGSMWADAGAAAAGATFVFTLPHDGAVAANESGA